jgi:hypothetical protein
MKETLKALRKTDSVSSIGDSLQMELKKGGNERKSTTQKKPNNLESHENESFCTPPLLDSAAKVS